MRRTMTAVAALTVAAGAAQAQFVYLGNFGGHDYWHTPNAFYTFAEARTAAATFGPSAYLVSINTAGEQGFLNTSLGGVAGGVHWMGLEGAGTGSASFNTWDSGEAVTYTNWAGDAILNDTNFRFGSFNWNSLGVWYTLGPEGQPFGRKRIVVEVVPTPGAAMIAGLGALAAFRRKR